MAANIQMQIDAELELSGEQLQALFVDMDLPELAITGAAVVHDIRNAPLIAPGAGRVIGGRLLRDANETCSRLSAARRAR